MLKNNQLIAHQVFFTFKDGIDWNSDLARKAEQTTKNHINEIEQIHGWYCGRSTVDRAQSVDFSLIGFFKSYSDLDEYMVHPDHQKGVLMWRNISTWKVSDILIDTDQLKLIVNTMSLVNEGK
ncbi:Dabb family protein [Endozoicomonas sp. SM1973]|uniref:Dabb family protein n=1 Tax=Spartinivicinus marinus TaxID=2994442 RepID=A0A853IFY4_9GAMM|nr:Dabb family protein [Spartinivicinus marinus]NYZ68891.1 Dabb family protein [Spartinivicinus marinus]